MQENRRVLSRVPPFLHSLESVLLAVYFASSVIATRASLDDARTSSGAYMA